jgi:hypothetical protein
MRQALDRKGFSYVYKYQLATQVEEIAISSASTTISCIPVCCAQQERRRTAKKSNPEKQPARRKRQQSINKAERPLTDADHTVGAVVAPKKFVSR